MQTSHYIPTCRHWHTLEYDTQVKHQQWIYHIFAAIQQCSGIHRRKQHLHRTQLKHQYTFFQDSQSAWSEGWHFKSCLILLSYLNTSTCKYLQHSNAHCLIINICKHYYSFFVFQSWSHYCNIFPKFKLSLNIHATEVNEMQPAATQWPCHFQWFILEVFFYHIK